MGGDVKGDLEDVEIRKGCDETSGRSWRKDGETVSRRQGKVGQDGGGQRQNMKYW